jgi:hypothetical protein
MTNARAGGRSIDEVLAQARAHLDRANPASLGDLRVRPRRAVPLYTCCTQPPDQTAQRPLRISEKGL